MNVIPIALHLGSGAAKSGARTKTLLCNVKQDTIGICVHSVRTANYRPTVHQL